MKFFLIRLFKINHKILIILLQQNVTIVTSSTYH